MGCERAFLDNPFKERFNLNIEACIGVLAGDNAVDSRVSKSSAVVDGGESVFGGILGVFYEAGKSAGGVDGVFAGDDGEGRGGSTTVNSLGNDGSDEFEDVRSNSAGNLEVPFQKWYGCMDRVRGLRFPPAIFL